MKKEIEFDFSKWGQEGISVETYTDNMANNMVTLHKNHINNLFYGIDEDGDLNSGKATEFKMYEEVKPREFWVIMYGNKSSRLFYDTKEQAQKYLVGAGIIIKVVEVIE